MPIEFFLLAGLPGSGKSYFASEMGVSFLDDISQNGGLFRLQFDDSVTQVVIIDYGFIFEHVREQAENLLKDKFPGCSIKWHAWVNDPVSCWNNIQNRKDGRVISINSLRFAATKYTYPKNAVMHQVYR